jgi:hypothetical protein
MSETVQVTKSLLSAPLPLIIERLGVAIAEAQRALDENSVQTAAAMAVRNVELGGERYSLLALGFTPTFYGFTEATVEAKLSFSMTESTEVQVGGSLAVGVPIKMVMVAASVNASYARKFSVSAEGTSSIAARIVSLPTPDILADVLRRLSEQE